LSCRDELEYTVRDNGPSNITSGTFTAALVKVHCVLDDLLKMVVTVTSKLYCVGVVATGNCEDGTFTRVEFVDARVDAIAETDGETSRQEYVIGKTPPP
jgi:formylmethanofuran dehydrogenase subunit B